MLWLLSRLRPEQTPRSAGHASRMGSPIPVVPKVPPLAAGPANHPDVALYHNYQRVPSPGTRFIMVDPYPKVHWANRPFGCDLRRLSDWAIIAYKFLTSEEMIRTRPGEVIDFEKQKVVVDNVGPLFPGGYFRKKEKC